ncbi:MAG: hypothetical protein JNM83_21525 [Myxococcales bacterium]|nr:hypothetical protein [Myxococcales bacterium]
MIPHEILAERSDERSAPNRTHVLTCGSCRAPVPLGFSDSTECLKCQQPVPIPESLRHRRDNFRKLEAERRQRDPLWRQALSARPHFYLRPLLLASLSYVAPFVGILVGYVFAYRDGHYGLSVLLWLWVIGAVHLVSSWLLVQRKPLHVRQLMTAQSPDEPGLPPSCRVCSSPLSVPQHTGEISGSFDCSCDHCGADNIVGDAPLLTPRPDLYSIQAAHQEVFGGLVQQRMDRLYPFILLIGFLVLGGLAYVATNAPQTPLV